MSRAYRLKVRESLKRVIRAGDKVSTQLELLGVLPPEEMAGLLGEELVRRGFERRGNTVVRERKGVTVTVELETGTVRVQAEASRQVQLEGEKEDWADADWGHDEQIKARMRERLRQELEHQAEQEASKLQGQATSRLEAQLAGLRQELDQASNRVIAEALKKKAAQLGQIKEMTEDPQSGSLTIVLEV